MKKYRFKIFAAALLFAALYVACRKENHPPDPKIELPAWEVQEKRTLLYEVEFRGFTKGEMAQKRSTTLELTFLGDGQVKTRFADEPGDYYFTMDSTGALTPSEKNPRYSPILDVLALFPPEGISKPEPGSQWNVLTPSEKQVSTFSDACIVQSRRQFQILSGDASTVRIKHDGFLRVVDNEAAQRNFETLFGKAGGTLARAAWTPWRFFQTGETEYRVSQRCLSKADYVAVILPAPGMDVAALKGSPEREELTIRIRP